MKAKNTQELEVRENQIVVTRPLRWGGEPYKIVKSIPLRFRCQK